jgi:hypothetical protein
MGNGSDELSGMGVNPLPSGIRIGEVPGARRVGPCIGVCGDRDDGAEDSPEVCASVGRERMVPTIRAPKTDSLTVPPRRIDLVLVLSLLPFSARASHFGIGLCDQ